MTSNPVGIWVCAHGFHQVMSLEANQMRRTNLFCRLETQHMLQRSDLPGVQFARRTHRRSPGSAVMLSVTQEY